MHPEDQRLLEITGDLCTQLGFGVQPRTINWKDRMGVRRFPPDYMMIYRGGIFSGTIILSKQAMGKLTPEEWRPLLASAVAYYENLSTGMLRAMLPVFAIMLLEPFLIVANFRFLESARLGILDYLILSLLFVLLGLGFVLMLRRMKSLFFKADQRAAQLVGTRPLVNSLMKMASIDGRDSVNRKGIVRPSVSERINHLTESPLA